MLFCFGFVLKHHGFCKHAGCHHCGNWLLQGSAVVIGPVALIAGTVDGGNRTYVRTRGWLPEVCP